MLELLDELLAGDVQEWYPIGPGVGEVVIRQLGEFREERALEGLRTDRGEVFGWAGGSCAGGGGAG